VIASLALMLLSVFAPRATAAVVAEAGALSSIRSAPLPLPSFAAPPALSAPFPAASAALAAPSLVAAPAAAAAPLAPAPLAPAPALQAAPAAALSAAPPAARLVLAQAAVPEPATAAAAFDGGLRAPALDWAPAVAPIDGRPPSRLQLLSAAELGVEHEPEAPRPPSSDPQPFLYRHYRFARAVALPILKLLYRVRVDGLAQLPPGPVMIVPNHVSFLDPVLISYAANRPMRFLMYRPIYETRGLQWLFRSLGAVPISTKDPKDVIEESLNRLRRALAAGESVVIFPEGTVTRDGDFSPFRRGFERVALGLGVPVVPAFVDGMWGSALSRHPLKSWRRSLIAHLRGRRSTAVLFGPQLDRADAGLAREAVATLAAPHPVSAASSEARGGEFTFVERRGVNRFGQEIVLLDALDARDPGAGTAAHIDFSLGKGQASLDEPLDLSSTVKMPHPAGAPVEADLSHLPRPHLWFGLAVKPEYQGRGLGARILDAAVARMRLAGTRTLFIRATESSRDFYLRHFGASVRAVDSETDGEGETYYRLEVDLTKP
jgi:1-acyl-sn-glycerol-3-phosphate acyltransferase